MTLHQNKFTKDYLQFKNQIKSSFPVAYNLLEKIENLQNKGYHIGTHTNLNLYYKSHFILHLGLDLDYIDVRVRPNGSIKKETVDSSGIFFDFFFSKLRDCKTDFHKTIEIFDEGSISYLVNKTDKSEEFFRLLFTSIIEFPDNYSTYELSSLINELVNEQQLSIEEKSNFSESFLEGIQKTISKTVYERNPKAREECLKHWKYSCIICGFNFEKIYGELGKDYIHVHHINEISSIKEEYRIDPINDLVPVCPNCHSMIHRNKEPLSIAEIKKLLK